MAKRQKVFKTGNSLAVTLPFRLVHQLGIKPGQEVEVKPEVEKLRVVMKFKGVKQLPLLGVRKKK
jgi:antitoxin component of MazEF toxin-antitoxin module